MEYKRLTFRYESVDGTKEVGYTEKLIPCFNKQAMILNRLAELEDKMEQGTLIELPCIVVGNGAIDAFGKVRVPYYQVLWLDEFGFMKVWKSTDKAKAEKRLKELQK